LTVRVTNNNNIIDRAVVTATYSGSTQSCITTAGNCTLTFLPNTNSITLSASHSNTCTGSINSFNLGNNNGRTLISIFNKVPNNYIFNFYTFPEHSQYLDPKNQYFFNEFSIFPLTLFKKKNNLNSKRYYSNFSSSYFFRLLKDFIWMFNHWNSNVDKWIYSNFKPTKVFSPSVNNPIILFHFVKFAQKHQIPILIYFTDEYLYQPSNLNVFHFLRKSLIKYVIHRAIKFNKTTFYCGNESLINLYNNKLGINGKLLINRPSKIRIYDFNKNKTLSFRITYIGNLNLNRWKTLLSLCSNIQKSNLSNEVKIDIFSPSISPHILNRFKTYKFIFFNGFLTEINKNEVLSNTSFLLNLESLDPKDKRNIMHTFSTKITDYLSYNIPIISYNPKSIFISNENLKHNFMIEINEPVFDFNVFFKCLIDTKFINVKKNNMTIYLDYLNKISVEI
jgi:hypothetical protein